MSEVVDKYLLDANVFIEASRRYYDFAFAEPFWNFLIIKAQFGSIHTIDKVYDEIVIGTDQLAVWMRDKFQDFCHSSQTSEILYQYSSLVNNVQANEQYTQSAKDEFMEPNNADTWLLAYALEHNYTIVTHEVPNPSIKKKVPIPNVCLECDMHYCNTFEMLKGLNFSF